MSRFYLVRHGRTAHNLARRIQGPLLDDSLDDVGRAQAAALGARFASLAEGGERFGGVYASPMRRALETAEPVARAVGCDVQRLPSVIEFSWGELLGQVEEGEVARVTRDSLARWVAGDVHHAPPGGESPMAASERVALGLEAVFAAHPDESFVVVAHGRINKILLAHLLHKDVARMEDFPQSNTGVTVLERVPGREVWRIVLVNDRSHLPLEITAAGDPSARRDAEGHGAEGGDAEGAGGLPPTSA